MWAALTDPDRLARWYGQVEGDLQEGGRFRSDLEGPDLSSVGRVDECAEPRRLRVSTRETDASAARGGSRPFGQVIEATLTPDGDQTLLVIEVRGLPLARIASYGVGWQLHAETLGSHLEGRQAPDVGSRSGRLSPTYEALAAELG